MEFKIFRNIENGFRQIRIYTIVFASLCLIVSVFSVGYAYYFAEKQREKIYVLDQGKSLMLALSQDTKLNRPVEAREHIRRFHELFFNLSPDKKAIEDNTKRAFYLADKSAFDYYKDLNEKGFYHRMISANIQQRIVIDSIRCDFDRYPYQVQTFAKQYITRPSTITERSLITSCRLINSVRSDNNPQGFVMEQFTIIENKDLQTIER